MNRLLQSSKFWTLIIDVVISLATYFATKYAAPSISEDIVYVIGAMQAVFAAVIGGIALEDAAAKRGDYHTFQQVNGR